MDGVAFTIASILIHDKVDYTMGSFYQSCTLDYIKALELMTLNFSDIAFSGESGRILKTDASSPPLAPLSTNEPCLAWEAWATW